MAYENMPGISPGAAHNDLVMIYCIFMANQGVCAAPGLCVQGKSLAQPHFKFRAFHDVLRHQAVLVFYLYQFQFSCIVIDNLRPCSSSIYKSFYKVSRRAQCNASCELDF